MCSCSGESNPICIPFWRAAGWDHLDLDPMARSDISRSLLEVLASRLNEALGRGACLRGSLDPCKLLLLCHQEYENTVTGMESELILCCHQQPHPSASHILSPSQCSLCLSITHPINEPSTGFQQLKTTIQGSADSAAAIYDLKQLGTPSHSEIKTAWNSNPRRN